ncbi:hypothetical protein D0T84_00505 [Dysgonomonas sp. 521]|uniref:hypothetical protein n=1 Tax=Dysgonomonas sp. 521 TaxID=2302932 RepID=UPI0013D01DF9|nr:hypothetical protein [Dysgonomonas sp. 521]NDV93399.1 hypothetical protein [Dysgonomonas sp. 521]
MTITEKLALHGDKELHLYKEGVFWVAYEEDAYLVSQIKKLKPTKKYIKSIQREVISVGFPQSSLEEVLTHFRLKVQEHTAIVLETDVPADPLLFDKWKKEAEIKEQAGLTNPAVHGGSVNVLVERLSSFKLHTASPMDCMRFVEKLQQEFC